VALEMCIDKVALSRQLSSFDLGQVGSTLAGNTLGEPMYCAWHPCSVRIIRHSLLPTNA
jgi:hypothetical protein